MSTGGSSLFLLGHGASRQALYETIWASIRYLSLNTIPKLKMLSHCAEKTTYFLRDKASSGDLLKTARGTREQALCKGPSLSHPTFQIHTSPGRSIIPEQMLTGLTGREQQFPAVGMRGVIGTNSEGARG